MIQQSQSPRRGGQEATVARTPRASVPHVSRGCCIRCFQASTFGSRVSGFEFWVTGFGFRISGFGFRISGFGSRVLGFEFWVSGFGCWVSDFVFRNQGLGARIYHARNPLRQPRDRNHLQGLVLICFTSCIVKSLGSRRSFILSPLWTSQVQGPTS